jgi:hypothetical protein
MIMKVIKSKIKHCSVMLRCRLMFILGVVTLGSSSLMLMEPTLPLYLQTTYKVQLLLRR